MKEFLPIRKTSKKHQRSCRIVYRGSVPMFPPILRTCDLNLEYVREFKIKIPKAPAFRTLQKREVTEIVQRLSSPAIAIKRTCKMSGFERSKTFSFSEDEKFSTLRINQPTVSSYIRFQLRPGRENGIKLENIQTACDKYIRHPPQGYIQAKYRNWFVVEGHKL